jgi:hypothetical protein
MSSAANYEIHIKEDIPEQWLESFDTIHIETTSTHSIIQIYLPDQAALHGLMARVRDLGLTLMSIQALPEEL